MIKYLSLLFIIMILLPVEANLGTESKPKYGLTVDQKKEAFKWARAFKEMDVNKSGMVTQSEFVNWVRVVLKKKGMSQVEIAKVINYFR